MGGRELLVRQEPLKDGVAPPWHGTLAELGRSSFAFVWVLGSVVLNTGLGEGLYLSQFLLVLTVWIAALRRLVLHRPPTWPAAVLAFGVGATLVSVQATPMPNPGYVEEAAKIALVMLGAWALIELEWLRTRAQRLFPVFAAATVVWALAADVWDYYDPILPRFGVPQWGSPNAVAIVIGAAMLFELGAVKRERTVFRLVGRSAQLLVIGVLAGALLGTFSRGGVLAFGAALMFRIRRNWLLAALTVAIAAGGYAVMLAWDIPRVDIVADLAETGGSGRLSIWAQLLSDLISDPVHILVGRGPGSIDLANATGRITSAHSTAIAVFYYYGIVGLAALAAWLVATGLRIKSMPRQHRDRLALPCFGFLVIGGLLDYYVGTAQLSWLFSLLLAAAWVGTPHALWDPLAPLTRLIRAACRRKVA